MEVNFEVTDVTRPPVAIGNRRGMTVVIEPRGSFVTKGLLEKPTGGSLGLEHSNGAYLMRLTRDEHGTKALAPIEVQAPTPVTKGTSELSPVDDTIDTTRDDAEAQFPVVVAAPGELGVVERTRHDNSHAIQQLVLLLRGRQWCKTTLTAKPGAAQAFRR